MYVCAIGTDLKKQTILYDQLSKWNTVGTYASHFIHSNSYVAILSIQINVMKGGKIIILKNNKSCQE